MSEGEIQSVFAALRENKPILLQHQLPAGQRKAGLVQAFRHGVMPSVPEGWLACLLLKHQYMGCLNDSGLVFSQTVPDKPHQSWHHDLQQLAAHVLLKTYDEKITCSLPIKATPDGGASAHWSWEAVAQDLVSWADLGRAAWMMVPDAAREQDEDAYSEVMSYAQTHASPMIDSMDVQQYALNARDLVELRASNRIPIDGGEANCCVYQTPGSHLEHVAMVYGDLEEMVDIPVRMHSECLTGDVLGSQRCDCGWQLSKAQEYLSQNGGVLLYLRQEGRGIGLGEKMKAYGLQDKGMDTVEANQQLGFAADARNYAIAIQILRDLGIKQVKLLTNNPHKVSQLNHGGINVVERVPMQMTEPGQHVRVYLSTKMSKLGHWLKDHEKKG